MTRIKIVVVFFLCAVKFVCFAPLLSAAEKIILSGELRCPYICDVNSQTPGFLIEIARAAFESKGHTVEFIKLPWSKAMQYSRQGKISGLAGVPRKNLADFTFPDEEQAVEQLCFYVKAGSPWRYTGLVSLRESRIGTIRNFTYGEIDSYIRKYQDSDAVESLTGKNILKRNIIKLERDRITTILEDHMVMRHTLNELGKSGQLAEAGRLTGERIYIAFPSGHSQSAQYAELLSHAMVSMRKSGKLNEILQRYGIEDWKE